MINKKLATQPYKGARDFYPKDMALRTYIFNTWRKVCLRYGFEEYDGPLLESLELYAAKSGDELVNDQAYAFEDKGGRKVAIRPEMTPTLARMVAGKYKELNFPIKWFSIPNIWRYEAPQKGRLREFFQLNIDVLGDIDVKSDFEIISLVIDLMLEFGATADMFDIRVNNRRLLDGILVTLGLSPIQKKAVIKALDKKRKVSGTAFLELLTAIQDISLAQVDAIIKLFTATNPFDVVRDFIGQSNAGEGKVGFDELQQLLELSKVANKDQYLSFDPTIVRGLDYYTGFVFEQFDKNPINSRSMYGGGRYDNLVMEFIDKSIPGVGLGSGDVTLIEFLNNWQLSPATDRQLDFFVTVWEEPSSERLDYFVKSAGVAARLREKNYSVLLWTGPKTSITNQLKQANKSNAAQTVILGDQELASQSVTIKDMKTGVQKTYSAYEFEKMF